MRLQSYDFFKQYQQKKIEKCIFRREVAYILRREQEGCTSLKKVVT